MRRSPGPLREILQAIRDTLEQTPPELSADISKHGILLAGGGTLIRGFADMIADDTGMPVFYAESPLTCVAVGSGEALAHLDTLNLTSRQSRAYADDAGLANRPGVRDSGSPPASTQLGNPARARWTYARAPVD